MDVGGLQRIVHIVINRMNHEKYDVHLCCLDSDGMFYHQLKDDYINKFVLKRKPGYFDFTTFGKLIRIIRNYQIDIIHSHNGCSMYAALAGSICSVKGIIHADHGRLIPDKKAAIWEDRLSSYMMDRIISVSEPLSDYLASAVKINKNKITTIINGVDTDKFTPFNEREKRQRRRELGLLEEAIIIGTVCRLDSIKNLDMLIGCVSEILQKDSNCQFLIVGDGPEEKKLRNYSLKIKQSDKIIFMGRSAEVNRVLPVFDIYVNTSLSEGTSMTILEAMSCGLPIIASAVGGNINIVNESNGMLFNLNDKDKFVDAIAEIIANSELRRQKGENSRKTVETQFSVDKMVEKYEQMYDSLLR